MNIFEEADLPTTAKCLVTNFAGTKDFPKGAFRGMRTSYMKQLIILEWPNRSKGMNNATKNGRFCVSYDHKHTLAVNLATKLLPFVCASLSQPRFHCQ